MILDNEDDIAFKKLTELYDYLVHNRDGLIPYKLTDKHMPVELEGIEYRKLSTMEHNICDVLAQRMKGRKMSCSIDGADNLSKILSEKFSNMLSGTVNKIYRNIIPNDVIDTVVTKLPLTVSKAIKESKKYKIYKCASSQIPYSRAAVTLGRKIVRDLCGLKSFSDIV